MSHNLLFAHVRGVLLDNGPLDRDGICFELPDVPAEKVDVILEWGLGKDSLVLADGRYELTDRGRR